MTNLIKLTGVTLPGTGYPSLLNFAYPTFPAGSANLVGLYTLGGLESIALRNAVTGVTDLSKIGSPTLAAAGATVNYLNDYASLTLSGTTEVTVIAIAKPFAANPANAAASWFLASQYHSTPTPAGGDGLSFYVGGISMWASTSTGSVQSPSLSMAGSVPANWNSFAGRVKSTGANQVWWGHEGVTAAGTEGSTNTRSVQTSRKWLLGGQYAANFLASGNLLMVAIFNSALTDQNILDNLAYLRASYGPQIGITTL